MSVATTPKLATDSGRTSLLMGLGVVAKLAVDVVIIAGFGLTRETDAFFVAYTLLILVESLIYPASQSGLAPIFIGAATNGGQERVWAVFNSLFTLAVIASMVLATGAVAASAGLSWLLAPGLDVETSALAARLSGLMLAGLLFVAPIGVMRAFLNAHQLYGAPASLELLRGVTVIAVILSASALTGALQIDHLAIGYSIAALVQALVFGVVIWRRLGPHYRPAIDLPLLRAVGVRRMLTLPLLERSIGQSVLIAERVIGSFLPPGSISALSYGHRLASVIGNILFTGVEVVSLSSLAMSLSARTAAGLREARATLLASVRLVILLGAPIGAMIWAVQQPVTRLLFDQGAGADGSTAALVLGIYALTIPLYGYLLLARSYLYAAGRPLFPVVISVAQLLAMVSVAPALAGAYGAAGIAWAYAAGQLAAGIVAVLTLNGIAGPGQNRAVLGLIARTVVAALATASAMTFITGQSSILTAWAGQATIIAELVILVLAGGLGAAVLVGMLLTMRVEEMQALRTTVVAAINTRLTFLYQGRRSVGPES